jgi:hypothetical protein
MWLAPWLALPVAPARLGEFPGLDEIPTLRQLAGLEAQWLPAIGRWLDAEPTAEEAS